MPDLTDIYYLDRASRYADPKNGNDRLPVVYGDLTDGTEGNWQLPCIDTTAYVYCYASHAVLSVAEGNSVSIYADGVLVDPGDYTFTASADYEGKGVIATIDFTADRGNAVISARGKGKAASGTLITNIVDIAYDFLTVHNSWTSIDFEATAKARASQLFGAQGYAAAGVIDYDTNIDETLTRMLGSFLGSWYRDGSGRIVFEIDTGAAPSGFAGTIRKADITPVRATQRLENIVNRCPASFAYNYVRGEFANHTDDPGHADAASQAIFGVREPVNPFQAYWCRDTASIQTIQDIVVAKFAYPLWEVEITDVTLKQLRLDAGDTAMCSIDYLFDRSGSPLLNHYWVVQSVRPDYAKKSITFVLLETAAYRGYPAARETTEY